MGKLKNLFTGLIAATAVASCGGGGSGGGFTGSGSGQGEVGAAHAVAISFPRTDAVSQLPSPESGFYRYTGTATVTDRNGNAVADGTEVQLDVIDSIIAYGTIGAADSITGTTLNDAAPNLSDDATATTLNLAYINHSSETRRIEAGDLVILTSNADLQDQVRYVSSAPTVSSLTVTSAYSQTYPNATYAAGTTTYLVGTSRIGASIYGVDADGNETRGIGSTKDGIIGFYVKYPANANTMYVGCGNSQADTRYADPGGFADTYVVARVGTTDVAKVSADFCFSSVLDHAVTTNPAIADSDGDTTIIRVADANNVGLPFIGVTAVSDDSTIATATGCTTVVGGRCTSTVSCNATGTAAITYTEPNGATGTLDAECP